MRIAAAALALVVVLPAAAQEPIPRTADGRPDLQGVWFSGYLTPLERPDGFDNLIIPAEEKDAAIATLVDWFSEGKVYDPELDSNPVPPALLEIDGEFRSSWIIDPADGKLPLTALAAAVMDASRTRYDHPEDRPTTERCIAGLSQAPMGATWFAVPIRVVQTPHAVVFAAEDMNPARIVTMYGNLPPDAMRSPDGYSRGRWEGDTLIVETSHFAIPGPPAGLGYRSAAPVTADSRVIERFHMRSANEMLYQFTVEDPALYKQPWLAEFMFHRVDMEFFEYACHEGNHSIVNVLTAARLGQQDKTPN